MPSTEFFLSFASGKRLDDFANINKALVQKVLISTVHQITHLFITLNFKTSNILQTLIKHWFKKC